MKKWLKRVSYVVVGIPLLLLAQCIVMEVSQQSGLEKFCAAAEDGGSFKTFLSDAANTNFKVRTGGPTGKDEDEWFDREYLRIGEQLKQTMNADVDYTVVFAKPGIGYYACIVIHDGALIMTARFEDRSS